MTYSYRRKPWRWRWLSCLLPYLFRVRAEAAEERAETIRYRFLWLPIKVWLFQFGILVHQREEFQPFGLCSPWCSADPCRPRACGAACDNRFQGKSMNPWNSTGSLWKQYWYPWIHPRTLSTKTVLLSFYPFLQMSCLRKGGWTLCVPSIGR